MKLINLITALLLLSACSSGGSSSNGGPPPPPFAVGGNASYEKLLVDALSSTLTSTIIMTPIQRASVEVQIQGTGQVVASGETDLNGDFSIQVPGVNSSDNLQVFVLLTGRV